MGISFSKLYLMLLSSVYGCQNPANENNKIISLLNQIHINHCIIIDEEYRSLFQSFKYFSLDRIFTTFMDIQYLMQYLTLGYFLNHKTAVIMKPDQILDFFNYYFGYLKHDLNHDYALSPITWIVFGTSINDVISRLSYFYIPYNCEFFIITCHNKTYEIYEIYNADLTNYSTKFVNNLGFRSQDKWELIPLTKDARRLNLLGISLLMESPNLDVCYAAHDCANTEILYEISKMMNFTITLIWFGYNKNATDPAIVANVQGVVYDGNYFYRDLFGPLFSITGYFHIKDDLDEQFGISTFTAPFSKKIWLRILFYSTISSAVIFCIEFWMDSEERKIYKLINSVIVALARPYELFCNQCGSKIGQNFPSRLAWCSIRAAASVIVPAYSATLISYVTVAIPKLPFTDLKSFLQDGTYKTSGINGTYGHMFFTPSTDPIMKEISENLLLNGTPRDDMEAVHWICDSSMKYSFLAYNNDIYQKGPLECKIRKIPKPIFSVPTGVQMPYYSPYKNVFIRNLHRFYTAGIIHKLKKHLMGYMPDSKAEHFSPITLIRIVPLLYLVVLGNLAGLLVLTIEIVLKMCKKIVDL